MLKLVMRIVTLLMFLGIMTGYTLAQYKEVTAPDNVLSQPIGTADSWFSDVSNVYWLDNETLLVELFREGSIESPVAYIYRADTGEIEELDISPLYLEPSPEEQAFYDFRLHPTKGNYEIYLSPYYNDEFTPIDMIYTSNLKINSGWGSFILMAGEYWRESVEVGSRYQPIDTVLDTMRVAWSSGQEFAIVLRGSPVVIDEGLYFVDLTGDYDVVFVGYLAGSVDVKLYALSGEGHRVIYSKLSQSGPSIDLVLWERTETIGEGFSETRITETIIPSDTDEYYSYAGANFVPDNPDEIVAIHADGLMQINVKTDERTLINPDLNADWIEIAFFSPDNRYVALVYQSQLYMVETGIGG